MKLPDESHPTLGQSYENDVVRTGPPSELTHLAWLDTTTVTKVPFLGSLWDRLVHQRLIE